LPDLSGKGGSKTVAVLHERCAGLDISKKDAKACVRTPSTKRRGPSRPRPHENQLVTVGNDRSVQIWDAVAGQGRAIVHGHGRRVNTVIGMARFAPGGLDPYLPEALRLPLDSIL
jgi:hypothetical protein